MSVVTIVMTTYCPPGDAGLLRLDAVRAAVASWRDLLVYEDGSVELVVEDDGSGRAHLNSLGEIIAESWTGDWRMETRPPGMPGGVGASLNRGIALARQRSPIVLYAVDDWALTDDLDIGPWVALLHEDESVGMVRLGPPHAGIQGTVEMVAGGWVLRLDRTRGGFVFGHRPALYHERFVDSYRDFPQGTNALECERIFNELVCRTPGPSIVLALPHPWEHIYSVELGDVEPLP